MQVECASDLISLSGDKRRKTVLSLAWILKNKIISSNVNKNGGSKAFRFFMNLYNCVSNKFLIEVFIVSLYILP